MGRRKGPAKRQVRRQGRPADIPRSRPGRGDLESRKPSSAADVPEPTPPGNLGSATVEWFRDAQILLPESKRPISFRVDTDVLDFFKAQGPRYQTRMNAVLRAYMTAHAGEE